MQQGSNASALAARIAGMTDEQILDLDLEQISANGGPAASSLTEDDLRILDSPAPNSVGLQGAVMTSLTGRRLDSQASALAAITSPGQAPGLGAVTSPQNRLAAPEAVTSNPQGEPFAQKAQDEPAWLRQLEAQPAAAAEARLWRESAKDVAALDAAYFSSDPGARSGLAARLYESDPAAFREMLAESARMLASRDPQALGDLARQLGMNETRAATGPARSLAQVARSPEASGAQNQAAGDSRSNTGFPTEAYRAFESATNEDVARSTREAIDRTLGSTLPEGVGEGARRRIGDDIFRELHATLSTDRELSRQVGEILRGWNFDGSTRQQVASLISSRARAAMPEVARRVVAEWTSSVLASDRARAARVDAAASRRDISGGRVPDTIPASGLLPRKVDYAKMTDEQILDL